MKCVASLFLAAPEKPGLTQSNLQPFERATDLIDDGILKLQSVLALSQQRQTNRIAVEATEVHQSLAKLQEDMTAAINERNVQAAALTNSLQEVLKELEGLPRRIHASAKRKSASFLPLERRR
jgi:hypothetical protein